MELDTNCFKAFRCAAETLNFTEAARVAHMTQSGVSHHVAKLERELGSKLFLRLGKKVRLTDSGRDLLSFVDRYEDQIRSLRDSIQDAEASLKGLVRYAMPESCLLSPHFSMLLKAKANDFPDVDLHVSLHHSEAVAEMVLNHESDFGFMTKMVPHPDLEYDPFCKEEYILAVPSSATKTSFRELGWIIYPGFDDISSKWRKSQALRREFNGVDKLRGRSNSLRAALTMVAHGLGITVAPAHCLESHEDRKLLRAATEGFRPSSNQIYIVTLKHHVPPARVRKTISTFHGLK